MADLLDDMMRLPAPRKPKMAASHAEGGGRPSRRQQRQVAREQVEQALTTIDHEAVKLAAPNTNSAMILREAFTNFETAVGGREALIEVLAHCPPTSVGASMVNRLLVDPAFVETHANTLFALCKKHKLSFNLVVQAFRDAKLAKVAIDTLNQVAKEVPTVVEQLVADSTNRWETCTTCEGEGRIPRFNEQMEFAYDGEGKLLTINCMECRGKGRKFTKHDFQNRSRLLDIAGLRADRSPLVQQTFNQQANIGALATSNFLPGDGSFESLMQAVEQTLKPTLPQAMEALDVQDVEIIALDQTEPASPEAATT